MIGSIGLRIPECLLEPFALPRGYAVVWRLLGGLPGGFFLTTSTETGSLIRLGHVSFTLDMGWQEKLLVELTRHVHCRRFVHCSLHQETNHKHPDSTTQCVSLLHVSRASGGKTGRSLLVWSVLDRVDYGCFL